MSAPPVPGGTKGRKDNARKDNADAAMPHDAGDATRRFHGHWKIEPPTRDHDAGRGAEPFHGSC